MKLKYYIFGLFKYDKYNPFRRYCKICNQLQVQFETNYNFANRPYNWWEDMSIIKNKNCPCHKHQKFLSGFDTFILPIGMIK